MDTTLLKTQSIAGLLNGNGRLEKIMQHMPLDVYARSTRKWHWTITDMNGEKGRLQ
jgi:hypothetical protein